MKSELSALPDLGMRMAAVLGRKAGAGRAIFFKEDPDLLFVATASDRLPAGRRGFVRSGAFARWIRVNGEMLIFSTLPEVWNYFDPLDRRLLESLRADAVVPLVHERELEAIVLFCDVADLTALRTNKPLIEAYASSAAAQWAAFSRATPAV
jgi:hypothetical protein